MSPAARLAIAIASATLLLVLTRLWPDRDRGPSPEGTYIPHDHSSTDHTAAAHAHPHPAADAKSLAEAEAYWRANPGDSQHLAKFVHLALETDAAQALRICDELLAKNPNHLFALNHGAYALLRMNRPQAALSYAKRCLRLADTAENRCAIGHIYRVMQQHDTADRWFRLALALDPAYRPALIGLGIATPPPGGK